jgi:hypothetical protein
MRLLPVLYQHQSSFFTIQTKRKTGPSGAGLQKFILKGGLVYYNNLTILRDNNSYISFVLQILGGFVIAEMTHYIV